MKTLSLLLVSFSLIAATVPQAQASNYPPDYPMCYTRTEAQMGPFKFIKEKINSYTKNYRLLVVYNGALKDQPGVGFYLKLNGKEITVQAQKGQYNDVYVQLNSGVHNCGMYNSSGWQCDQPEAFEHEFFTYAADAYGNENAWDVSAAAVINGRWDSNSGANYKVRFEPTTRCY